MLACPRCSELPSVWLSNRFFMMAMVCSTNWVLVSLIGTWKQKKYKRIRHLKTTALQQCLKFTALISSIVLKPVFDRLVCGFHDDNQSHSCTYRSLGVKELANAVPQLVEEHGVEGGTELQSQEVFHVGPDMEAHPVMATHQQGQQPVQEAADRRLAGGRVGAGGGRGHGVGHLARAHGNHGVFTLTHGAHGRAVGGWARCAALLETHATQSAQKACHVDPLLLWGTQREHVDVLFNTVFPPTIHRVVF